MKDINGIGKSIEKKIMEIFETGKLKKLDNVQPTQDSIQSLALWIIHHKANHETICRLWIKKLNDGKFKNISFIIFE